MSFTSTDSTPGGYGNADQEHRQQYDYPFLVHSQVSLTQNVPPRIDSSMMTRQKRRRTSPEDHTILEAAYQRNSKPDKAERTVIVRNVSLGEKEVQIWFQNRRQNDRRKSRPLLPHEMVPHFRNSIPQGLLHESTPTSQDGHSTPQASFSSVEDSERSFSSSSSRCDDHAQNASRASSIHDLLNPMSPSESDCSISFESQYVGQVSTQTSQWTIESEGADPSAPSRDCQVRSAAPSPRSTTPDVGDGSKKLAEKGNQLVPVESGNTRAAASFSIVESGGAPVRRITAEHFAALDPPAPSRKRAFDEIEAHALPSSQSTGIRLSMTLDGAVKVKTTAEETPSPPKQRPQNIGSLRQEGLKRSHSAIAASELLKDGQRIRASRSSGIFGRSRDARTWEFYCDGDARAALSAQADNENDGSAVGAIHLIRSQSQNAKSKAQQRGRDAALKPKMGAGNARKPAVPAGEKPRLVRAMSSMARLPSNPKDDIADINKSGKTSHARSPSGDSDKENWAPGTRPSSHPFRRTQPSSSASRDVLHDHLAAARSKTPGITHSPTNNHGDYDQESGPLEYDLHQVDSLTHGEDKEEDLDCIQGLLSLSQGAWR